MSFKGPSGATYSFDVTKGTNEYKIQALNQQDLDRNFCLATSNLFKWMQAARMELPWMQPGYRMFCELEPKMPRRMLVGSQIIKMDKPGILAEASGNDVSVRVKMGDIGRTTLEFRYDIFLGKTHVATGSTVMISTAGTAGSYKPHPVPEDIKALAAADASSNAKFMKDTLAAMPKDAPENSHASDVIVRHSDEDVNGHANHSAQARFFEDAKETIAQDKSADASLRSIAEQQLETIIITYTAEVSALDRLQAKVSASASGGLDVWMYRLHPKPALVARGHMICSGGKAEHPDDRRLRASKL